MTRTEERYSYSSSPQAIKPWNKSRELNSSISTSSSLASSLGQAPSRRSSALAISKSIRKYSTVNIMNDPRVIRGNTNPRRLNEILSRSNVTSSKPEKEIARPYYEFRYQYFDSESFDMTPNLIERPKDIQSKDKVVETLTEEFLPRPITPPYVSRKTGIDNSTQVEDVNELFHFEEEVAPIVSVIASKTIEQALWEVSGEQELILLQSAQEEYHELDKKHAEWLLFEEARTKAEMAEKVAIVAKHEKVLQEVKRIRKVVAAQQFMSQIVPHAIESVFQNLRATGVWKDPDIEACKATIMPDIRRRVDELCSVRDKARELLEEMLVSAENIYKERPMATYEPVQTPSLKIEIHVKQVDDNGEDEVSNQVLNEPVRIGPWTIDSMTTIANIFRRLQKLMQERSINSAELITEERVQLCFEQLLQRSIANDGTLVNYDLPEDIHISL